MLGAVGFAAGLFGIPLLVIAGVSFPDAVAMSLVAAAPQNLIPCWQLRREIDFRLALRPMLIRYAFMPLGVCTLWLIGQGNKDTASQIVGCVVLGIVMLQKLWRSSRSREFTRLGVPGLLVWRLSARPLRHGRARDGAVGAAHDWPMNKARVFLFFLFSTGFPVQALLMWSFFGVEVLDAMILAAAAFPAILGRAMGRASLISRRIPDQALRSLCTGRL